MKKKIITLLATITSLFLLTGCGGSEIAEKAKPSKSGESSSSEKTENKEKSEESPEEPEKVEITWSWGTLRGLYGDAEITFNEDGGRETIVMKYPNGQTYRTIEYDYGEAMILDGVPQEGYLSDKKVYPSVKTTNDENGTPIYQYNYDWMLCQKSLEQWGAGIASDVTPILEAGEFIDEGNDKELAKLREIPERYFTSYEYGWDMTEDESTGNISYQELSHLTLDGNYMDIYNHGKGYWITKKENGNPAKTWFYAPDGRLDEELTLTWTYENGKPISLQKGQYSIYTYTAKVSDDGRTTTYTLDESHEAEGADGQQKYLEQVYQYTLSYTEDGKPASFQYASTKDYLNTEEPEKKSYTITYSYENGVQSGAEYRIEKSDQIPEVYTITCNEQGIPESEE
ncbi:MAG: hypothetical protein SO415_07890 [Oliverpabstia sp.]|nr:hypothetical protein [Oliverpabstia sp.]